MTKILRAEMIFKKSSIYFYQKINIKKPPLSGLIKERTTSLQLLTDTETRKNTT